MRRCPKGSANAGGARGIERVAKRATELGRQMCQGRTDRRLGGWYEKRVRQFRLARRSADKRHGPEAGIRTEAIRPAAACLLLHDSLREGHQRPRCASGGAHTKTHGCQSSQRSLEAPNARSKQGSSVPSTNWPFPRRAAPDDSPVEPQPLPLSKPHRSPAQSCVGLNPKQLQYCARSASIRSRRAGRRPKREDEGTLHRIRRSPSPLRPRDSGDTTTLCPHLHLHPPTGRRPTPV
jgi:hypothetical protein